MFSRKGWHIKGMGKIYAIKNNSRKIQSRTKINKTEITVVKKRTTVNSLTATFTIPPSINGCYRSYNRRVIKSKKYCDWQNQQLFIFKSDERIVQGALKINVIVYSGKGWRKNRDLDNILKPLLDTLILIGFIEDDNSAIVKFISIEIRTETPAKQARLEVVINNS